MCKCDYVPDFYAATPSVQRRIQDPRVAAKRMRDRGHHGDSRRGADAADVREDDVADEEDFGEEHGILRPRFGVKKAGRR